MIYDLIIIGGGPAGITAGIYGSRQGLKILLITKDFCEQISKKAVGIENYTGFSKITGHDLIKKFKDHLDSQDIDIRIGLVNKIKKNKKEFLIELKGKDKLKSKAVIIASGSTPRLLKVPGEKKFIGKGLSYCAVCDGPVFRNKTVAIIGGGDSGFETAIFLSNYVKKIYILEMSNKVIADKNNQNLIKKKKNIEIMTNVILKRIKGINFVNSIIYIDKNTNKNKELMVNGVFVEIGLLPAVSFVGDLVDFNKRGEIKIDLKNCETGTRGLFAAGDVTEVRDKQIIIAAGEGAKAALSAYNYLSH